MMDTPIAAARTLAATWKTEAERRRRVSKHDAVADAIDYLTAELLETMRPFDAPGAMRTVEQYAADACVTPSCVRRWIAAGRLEATKTTHGYRILRTERVQPAKRKRGTDTLVTAGAGKPAG